MGNWMRACRAGSKNSSFSREEHSRPTLTDYEKYRCSFKQVDRQAFIIISPIRPQKLQLHKAKEIQEHPINPKFLQLLRNRLDHEFTEIRSNDEDNC